MVDLLCSNRFAFKHEVDGLDRVISVFVGSFKRNFDAVCRAACLAKAGKAASNGSGKEWGEPVVLLHKHQKERDLVHRDRVAAVGHGHPVVEPVARLGQVDCLGLTELVAGSDDVLNGGRDRVRQS